MLRAAIIACLLTISQSAFAVSAIKITAESITHDNAELRNADILVNLKATTTIAVKAEHVQYQTIEARNANIYLDYRGSPTLAFDTDLKQNTDKAWAKAQMHCLLPKNLSQDTWNCNEGKFTAERINLPFALQVTPQAKGFVANINLQSANFSDEAGLHAAEKLTGHLTVVARQEGDVLYFNSALN